MKTYTNPLINSKVTYKPGNSLKHLTYAHRPDMSEVEDEKSYVISNMQIAY